MNRRIFLVPSGMIIPSVIPLTVEYSFGPFITHTRTLWCFRVHMYTYTHKWPSREDEGSLAVKGTTQNKPLQSMCDFVHDAGTKSYLCVSPTLLRSFGCYDCT